MSPLPSWRHWTRLCTQAHRSWVHVTWSRVNPYPYSFIHFTGILWNSLSSLWSVHVSFLKEMNTFKMEESRHLSNSSWWWVWDPLLSCCLSATVIPSREFCITSSWLPNFVMKNLWRSKIWVTHKYTLLLQIKSTISDLSFHACRRPKISFIHPCPYGCAWNVGIGVENGICGDEK